VSAATILELDDIDAVIEPFDWDFQRSHEHEIETIWQREISGKPEMFNGRVLIQHRGLADGRIFRCAYSETDYRTFLSWHRLGHPGAPVRNGFGMAALRASDGAFLLGEMAAHTANAGKIYFAAGTPDLDDIVEGKVDLAGSVLREMSEETGLLASEVKTGEGWTAVVSAVRIAFMRRVEIAMPAAEARALMLERMKHLPEQELADIHIVRDLADLDEARMPLFQLAYLRHAFAA
jgi:8-oxo-dGTP pyrophosphatase MutT (NUDIX family)